ncbi:MAG: SIS domain-containing protein [Clostridia bacterium]|nr:SIS domain-containing protein [Clostridia bacterium]
MSKTSSYYLERIIQMLSEIEEKESGSIDKAAGILAEKILEDRLVHVIGPGGHSNMGVEEVFWRAGGLAPVNGILDAGTNLIHGAKRSNIVERTPGYAKAVFNAYRLEKGDVLVIVNAYGINSMTIDCALECKERGITSIGITSTEFADQVPRNAPSRHPSGLNLYDNVDVFINNHLPMGDSIVPIEGLSQTMGATSTYANSFVLNLLMMRTAEKLIEKGTTPPVWMSANLPGGDLANKANEAKYMHRIKHLM